MSAKDKEKYYWWKKDKNYYSDHRLKALEKEKNGYAYSILLEKIKCESTPYQGLLRYSEKRAFTVEELSAVVDMPLKIVKSGLEALKDKELIDILEDGTIKVFEFENCVGWETGAAKRKREYREGTKEEDVPQMSPEVSPECPQDIRVKSQELRIDDDNNKSSKSLRALAHDYEGNGGSEKISLLAARMVEKYEMPASMFTRIANGLEAGEEHIEDVLTTMHHYRSFDEETFNKLIGIFENVEIVNKNGYITTVFKNKEITNGAIPN